LRRSLKKIKFFAPVLRVIPFISELFWSIFAPVFENPMKIILNASENDVSFRSLFAAITKARLAISVVFSSVAGYLLGFSEVNPFSWATLILLTIGGYCMVGASNVFNQVIEKDLDALMDRTKNRPVPSGKMSVRNAFGLGVVLTVVGLAILYSINPKTAMFGAISIFLYTSVYTPLKTITPLAVFVGAFPGAIPYMLGWVAATNDFDIEAGTLFLIQFFWQFPHFWAIGWFLFEDYKKGGFFMLPTGRQDKKTALQIILYTCWLILASLLPVTGFTGELKLTYVSGAIVLVLGLWMLLYAVKLYNKMDVAAARKLMLVSVSYISLLQIIYIVDKFIR
jgi:protoheme IX farnesyltransferase